VRKALHDNAWVWKIVLDENFTMAHLHQFVNLWVLTNELQLIEETKDDISWNLTTMVNTPQGRLMMFNSLPPPSPSCRSQFVRLGHLLKQNSSLGSSHKTAYGLPTILENVDGPIMVFALFASKSRNRFAPFC
jgi:hypothetical protein